MWAMAPFETTKNLAYGYWLNHTILEKLSLWKIIKIVATRLQILRLKCTKFDFGWVSAPDPAGELTALPQTP